MAVEIDELAGPDGGEEGRRVAEFWKTQLEKINDDTRYKRWIKRGHTIEKRYRDERTRTDEDGGQRRYNALWSNVEILTPAIYGRCPMPVAERRFKDKDPIGRGASQILERGLRNEIEICNFHEAVEQAVLDYLLPGRGTVWVRYEPELEEGVSVVTGGYMDMEDDKGEIVPENEKADAEKLRDTGDRIVRESTQIDYINWEDFFTFPFNARTWKEVTAVGKRVYMTRDQLKDRFGPVVGKDVPLKKDDRGSQRYDGPDQDPDDKGEVYEIWSLTGKEVLWIADDYEYLLDRKDDPLALENFFPCPRPLYANATTGTLIPVPDYIEYQDQAVQIDELTQRIAMLTKACKVAGVYNAAAKDIQRLLNESVENELLPVDDWAAFAEKGGVEGQLSFLPLKEIIGVINELAGIKEKQIAEMDRLTGITDIMRGTTDARETLGGQRLKTNSAGTRLQRRQNEVARFARDTVRIIADIMAQHFSPQSLIEVSGALYTEGLGDVAMPSLTDLQQPPNAPPQLQLPPPPSPLGGQAAPGPIPNTPPQPQNGIGPGSNVVPFPQQGQVPPPTPMGGPSPMPMGMPPGPMLPPEKLEGLKRIAAAIQLIRNERLRGFRVDIEVDSTIYGDAQQEKGDRTEFIKAVTEYLQQAMQMSAQIPEATPLLGKLLQFGVRGFRVGRDLEATIDEFCDEAVILAKQKAQENASKPNPEEVKMENDKLKAEAAMVSAQAKSKAADAKSGMDAQLGQQKMSIEAGKAQAEVQRQQTENAGEQANSQADMEMKRMDVEMRHMELEIEKIRMQIELAKMHAAASGQKTEAPKTPSESISYKDLPPDGKVQMAAQAGIEIDTPPPEPVKSIAAKPIGG